MSAAPVRIALFGAAGRMGRSIIAHLRDFPGLALAAAVEAPGSPALGADAATLAGAPAPCGVAVTDDAASAVAACDIVVDFTFHEAVPAHAALALARRKALLVGTTALSPEERAAALPAGGVAPGGVALTTSVVG